MFNFTINMEMFPNLLTQPLFNISSICSFITQKITDMFPTLLGEPLLNISSKYISHTSQPIIETSILSSEPLLNISYIPQQTMETFPSILCRLILSISFLPKKIMEIYPTILDQPLLNTNLNYAYIPQQITALKCFLLARYMEKEFIDGNFVNFIFFLITIFCILPNIILYSVWNAVIDFGVIFSFCYVDTIYHYHRDTAYFVYDLALFFACILCTKFEAALDFYIILLSMYEYYTSPMEYTQLELLFAFMASIFFFCQWWDCYWHRVHAVVNLGRALLNDFSPTSRNFRLTILYMLFLYRMLGFYRMYI